MKAADSIMLAMIMLGSILGLTQRLIRTLISSFMLSLFIFPLVPMAYGYVGSFFAAMLMMEPGSMDGAGFVLTTLTFVFIAEIFSRWGFKDTRIMSIGLIDRVLGAVAGLLFGALIGLIFIAAMGGAGSGSGMGAMIEAMFRSSLGVALRYLYPPGYAPILDNIIR
jgi:hypothetical protein